MKVKSVALRRASTSDADSLEAIRAGLSREYPVSASIQARLDAPGVFTYLAETKAPFGFITIGSSGDLDIDDLGEICEWYLSSEFQGCGLGQKLLVHGLSVLKRRLCESAVIWLPQAASRARQIMLKHGFEPYGAERVVNSGESASTEQAFLADLSGYF